VGSNTPRKRTQISLDGTKTILKGGGYRCGREKRGTKGVQNHKSGGGGKTVLVFRGHPGKRKKVRKVIVKTKSTQKTLKSLENKTSA